MDVEAVLGKIHDPWVKSVLAELNQQDAADELISGELERFFELLGEAIKDQDPGWLNPLLIDWAASRTETDMAAEEITISPILKIISESMLSVAVEFLSPEEANALAIELMPIMYYAYEKIAQHESLVRVSYYSARLDQVTDELSRLDKTKSDFISVAAHELKTPLTLIEGYSSMLEDTARRKSDLTAIELVGGIKKGIGRLEEMIGDMIDISMIDNQVLALRYQPMWINQILDGLAIELSEVVAQRNLTLEIEPFDGFKQMILADPERIQQAIRNVLTNAIKYTPDGGKITVDGRELSGFLEVRIEDTGIGISPEDQITIFEKFSSLTEVRLHSSSKTNFKGGGPGLGLPIARGILTSHGGSIWVESDGYDEEKLQGSIFHLLIPIRTEPPDVQMTKLFRNEGQDA